jgi:putative tricarboxylic transport membrane protein
MTSIVKPQAVLGAGVLALGAFLAIGSREISSEAGYGGVGPNFLPLVTGLALLVLGAFLIYEAATGGFRSLEEPSGAAHGHWVGFAWVSAGIIANALLIERIGFILACGLCYLLAVRGLRLSKDEGMGSLKTWLLDAFTGLAIAAPVFWLFTKALSINLPGLTGTGWL